MINQGITKHKTSTLNELEILAECEPDSLILAYPITSKIKSERLSKIVKKFPKTKFSTIISTQYHYDLIKEINNLDDDLIFENEVKSKFINSIDFAGTTDN